MSDRNESIPRLEKAFKILEDPKSIVILPEKKAMVHSMKEDKFYHIDYKENTCECPDNFYRNVKCTHLWAVLIKVGIVKVTKTVIT